MPPETSKIDGAVRLAQLERILSTATDGIVAIDKQGRYFYANEAAERILGIPKAEILRRTFDQVPWKITSLKGNPLPLEETAFQKVLQAQSGVYGIKLAIEREDGQRVITLTNAAPLYDAAGTFDGMVAVFTDISEQHEIQERINAFHHTLAHDLRGPLTVIIGHAEILKEVLGTGRADSGSLQNLSEILNGAEKMNKMIEDLVDSARLEGGQFTLAKTAVDLKRFLLTLLHCAEGAIPADRLAVEIPEDLPWVAADPDRLERIFQNLLSNALKFSPAGSKVIVQARRADDEIIVSVTDKGKGIAPEDCSHLFRRYFQVKGEQSAKGAGLGLYISRLLVEAHGGHIWVVSKVGEGSTFHFTLPVTNDIPG
ncbi:MAG: PAS domain S-box protein [Deltaproteobacteria bacterium]|nr:MAG: PAS domain S-box protein [Deltaproteobacteria bacterium]